MNESSVAIHSDFVCRPKPADHAFYNQILLTPAQRDLVDIVLVSPRNPLNIGAVARAMANFGFSRLAVAAAFSPHWREAKSAVGAPQLLATAGQFPTLADAIQNCTFVIGTGTRAHRKPEQPVVELPDLGPLLSHEFSRGGRAALVFGPEKHGLTRDDLSWCHVMVEVPTDPKQPSMNLGQAAAVCLYELACRNFPLGEAKIDNTPPQLEVDPKQAITSRTENNAQSAATSTLLERVAEVVEESMTAAGYSPNAMRATNRHDLRVMLRRLNLSAHDARRVLGVFRRMLWRMKRSAD